ncbi:hypothetical protein KSC_108600 [Ktedonobacter sp. SOSP1-52]|uniref:serine/threonine protein kinase n=1 Tax=Ktedonobacter sp. SOSP1-52 TaxID=2778366 RepID=UPI001916ADC3|nr:serine/threonine-protein kinase [Ktedonobacter sp. SOSP1-52]GHO71968.1 hypothetical protein KSC_108600 [Ktedonobacter sp. SOSP1-52]
MIGKSTQDLVNQPIIDRYRLLHFINRGETKSVYQAVDVRTARPVAFKLMRLDQGPTDRQQRIQQFGKIMERIVTLDYPHILPVLDFGVTAGEQIDREHDYVYVVMPLIAERSLDGWLHDYWQRRNSPPAQLELQDVQQLIHQAAQSLQYAHERNVLHLGIKQTNFLVRRKSDNERLPYLELADFSVARLATPSRDQTAMAPEQLAGRPVAASDQYALAAMAYELLTGHPSTFMRPNGQSYTALFAADVQASRLSAGASEVLQRALAPDPQARYTSIIEFAEEFAHVAERGKRGENLYILLGISRAEAQSGTSLPVTLAGKRQVMVNVPPNSHAGQILQIEDAGKPSQSSGPRGALVVTLALRPDPPGIQPGNNQPVLEELQRLSHDIKALQARSTNSSTTPANASADMAGLSEQVTRIEHMIRILRTFEDYVEVEGPQDIPRYLAKQFRPGLVVVGIVLALIIILSNCVLSGQLKEAIYLNGTSNIDAIMETNKGMTATAQANVNGTATTSKNAQATATATYLQSVQAAADSQTIPALYHTNAAPENVSLVFNDLLNKSNSGQWENSATDDGSDSPSQQNLPCFFGKSDNFYHAKASKSGTVQLCHSSGPVGTLERGTHLLLQVQAFILIGDSSGMQFGTKDSYCYFYITQTGEYEIGMNGKPFTNGKGKDSAINTGTGTKVSNLIAINISDTTVTFYVNLQPVLTVNEVTLPDNGTVALAARGIGDPTDAAYQKIKAWQY